MISTGYVLSERVDERGVKWRKASGPAGNCAEVARVGENIRVRDDKDPASGVLSFDRDEWESFLSGVRDGAFDFDALQDLTAPVAGASISGPGTPPVTTYPDLTR